MNRTKSKQSRKPVRVAGALALVLGLSLAAVYASGLVSVASVQASGSVVTVDLVNSGSSPARGSVVVTAMVGGSMATSSAPFALGAGKATSVSVGFSGTVQGAISAGAITEDGTPF